MTSILKADNIQDADGNNIINESGNTITIGASGDTISIPSGATIANSGTATGFGLTMADQWRLNSTYTVTNSSAVLTNLEQVDTDGFGGIGTAMTESSGIFTFPTTGIYLITGTAYLYRENSGSANVTLQLQTTTDNSNYNGAAISAAIVENVSAYEANINLSFMFDVTDTSTHKCKFMASSNNNNIATMYAETAQNTTYFTFLRLGDT